MGSSKFIEVRPIVIFQLIYTCALTNNLPCSELEAIAKTSRARNLEREITGILLCKDGSILQVLEGDKTTVLALYETIKSDSRIKNPLLLFQRTSAVREFPNWSMGFKDASETEAVFELCAQTFPDALPDDVSPEVGTIGRTFARVNGLT